MLSPPVRASYLALCFAPLVGAASGPSQPPALDRETARAWVEEFKESPKGPFENIRWFCKDGTVLPPKAYACAEHGGGVQHGTLNERAIEMRAAGYRVANVLATLEPEQFVGDHADLDLLKQILVERFLIGWDDGWIFRGARSYRGAFQIEDEEAGSRAVVLGMLDDPRWRAPSRFMLVRESARLLPLQADESSAAHVRQLALQVAEKDEEFTPLRAKIHGLPDSGDAARVRGYAGSTRGKAGMQDRYEQLAEAIDSLYAATAADALEELAGRLGDADFGRELLEGATQLEEASNPGERLAIAGRMLGLLRGYFPKIQDPETALAALETSLALEDEVYTTGNSVVSGLAGLTRRERLALLDQTGEALYGAGFITSRHLSGIKGSLARINAPDPPSVDVYREELRYLARTPEWSGRWLAFNFGPTVETFARIEPEAHLYPQDRLRGSPLLVYGAVVDDLVRDANGLAGIEHDLFGERVGAGLRALNPGLTRGTLLTVEEGGPVVSDGIYLLPETTSDLPAVSGILTQGEGSSLSHVQLLARNLGIPNVVVSEEHLPKVRARLGTRVVLAVSPNGVVELIEDAPGWDGVFGTEEEQAGTIIRPDLKKLDIRSTALLPLSSLRARDSGRTSGPKGANLGELKHHFGDAVPDGFVVPFGVFRQLLDTKVEEGGPSVFEWMKERYAAIAAEGDPAERQELVSEFLSRLRAWILSAPLAPEFREALRAQLERTFGEDGTYGAFVRSDTNVEDLPGFTGAGLNLTVPNVVGYENILTAIHEVWASPFTERAYGWRQAHMEDPEYVFPAVVIQYSFPAEKSGVMVTTDVDRSDFGWLSVAVNEGVGGAVEGQASESLLIPKRGGRVQFLAQATAPDRAVLDPAGGIEHVPASGTSSVLTKDEIIKLILLVRDVEKFPSLRDEKGRPMPADIEFGFRDGELALLQIRPFVESRRAQSSTYLGGLDAGFADRGDTIVALDAVPSTAEVGKGR